MMKLKVIETVETIWELPDNHFDEYDYDEEDCDDNEIADHYQSGKRLQWEITETEISYDTYLWEDKQMKRYRDVYEYSTISHRAYSVAKQNRKWCNTWVVVEPNKIQLDKPITIRRLKECLT